MRTAMKTFKKTILLLLAFCVIPLGLFCQSIGITGDSTINRCEIKSYTISILNNSGNPLTNLVIVARLENLIGFSYVTGTTSIDVNGGGAFCTANPVISGGYSGNCAPGPGVPYLTWDIDAQCPGSPFTLNNGDTLNITFQLETDCTAVSGSLNTYIDYTLPGPTPMCDDTGVLNIQVNPGAVTIKKTPNVIPQVLGQDVTWTLTVENTGLGVIENVEVTDVLGAGLAYVSSTQNGNNSGQTTTWTANEYAALASMDPGDILTMDITATVIACDNLDNTADVRFGCDPGPTNTCFDTSVDGGTAQASVQRIVRTPNLAFTPPDINFTYCSDTENISFTITNVGDGIAYDVFTIVDFGGFIVSNVSAGAIYNNVDKRFELAVPLAASGDPGDSYNLSFDLTYSTWCGSFPSGDLLWQTLYKDECDQEFYPPVELSTINAPAASSSLSVSKNGAGAVIQIGDPTTYTVTSSYSGPINCGSGTTSDITVVDTVPNGFIVTDAGGGVWVPGGGGTGGTITWTYTPPASLNTTVTFQSPPVAQCETYCNTTFTNSITASGIDCCGCALNASDSETTAIECAEDVTSDKTSSSPTERCDDTTYTNTYNFSGGSGLVLSNLQFEEHAELQQEYNGNLTIMLGAADVTGCVAVTDNTPGGSLLLDFSGCAATPLAGQTLTITYDLTATANTVAACGSSSFYSWSSLDMGPSGSNCLGDGIIHETTVVNVVSPSMSLSITGLGQIIHTCETKTITMILTQTSANTNPRDVKLVLSGLNYYVVNPAATICGGIAPVSCTPTIDGSGDYVWTFNDAFTGSGQSATIQLEVQKRCGGTGDLVATAYFDDLCTDDATADELCSVVATETPALLLSGDLLIEKTPETYYAVTNQVQWEIYVTNRGTGTAYNVWVDDVLGSGLLYEHGVNPVVVDDMTGVTINDSLDHNGGAINGASVEITSMAAGERRQITFIARQIDCNNLTNDVSASWGCIGVDCQTAVTDNSIVSIPAPNLINTNTITPAGGVDACSSPDGFITLRNTGQITCYNLQVTETLPPNLLYVSGSTRWRLNGGPWNGPNVAYDPNPTVSPLVWTSTEIPGLAISAPGDTIEIEFDMISDCPFTGGDITVSTQYENPCADVFTTADSTFTAAFNAPDITLNKTRANDPINCNDAIQWTITVTNNSGYTLPIIWVEDTMDATFTYASSVGDPPYTSDNGTNVGQVVTWELRNVNPGDTVTLTLNATTDSAPCSPDLDNTVIAYWGCGAADGSSATKPGVDAPDDTLCLTSTGVTDVRTETRQPSLSYLSIVMSPVDIDACNDSTQLTIVMENAGPTDAYTIDLAITLPPGIIYNAGTAEAGLGPDQTTGTAPIADPDISGSTITFYDFGDKGNNLTNLIQAIGGNDTLVLRFTVRSACYVTSDVDFDLRFFDCCDDNQYTETTQQQLTALFPSLSVTKTANLSQVDCGNNVEYTIQVTNNGTGNAEVVLVQDTLGDWLDYAGNFTEDHPGTVTPALIGGFPQVVGWEFNNLGSGATATFTFEATLNPDGLPNQNDCTAGLRQNNVLVQWACGTSGDATDDDPNTNGYDCTQSSSVMAGPVTLEMPNLVVTSITPDVSCTSDGTFSGTISVRVTNNGDGDTSGTFTVEVTDGKGWTGTGTHNGTINNGNSVDVTINTGTWAPDCHACAAPYSFTATVDTGNTVCECDESDNDFGPYSYTAPIPDLIVTDIDFSNVSCTNDNISGTVDVIIRNNACVAATNFEVSLTTDGCLSFSNETVASLAAETSTIVSFSISGSWSDCTVENCQFTAEVDPTDAVCECDGTNNDRVETYSTTLPDLVVTDIDFSNVICNFDNFSGFVSVTVQNQGFGSAVGFQVSLTTDGCFTFGNQTVSAPLGPGASTTVSFPITLPWMDCTDCTCQFTAAVDPTNVICECDGTNNQYTDSYTQILPDLRVNSVTPAAVCNSDGNLSWAVTVNVENVGCGDANNVVVSLLSTCDIVFADQTVNLTTGASTDLTFNYTPDCSVCTCIFIAVIDPDSLICECSGANNAMASIPYTLNVPDITVQTDTLAINCTDSEQVTVSGTVTLANPGCGLIFNASIPMRFTLYDNTGCGGNVLDQWTQNFSPANILPNGGTQAFTITPRTVNTNLCDNSTGCQVSIRIEADYSDNICECDGTNNTYCADNKNIDIPNLEVSGDTLGVTCFDDGQFTISGSVTMVNNGCGSNLTDNIPVRFTLFDNTGCGGSVLNQWTETLSGVNIAAGGGNQVFTITPRNVTTNLVENSTGCLVSIRVEADYNNTICECDDTDNTYCADNKAVDIPDLEVSSDTLSISCLSDGQVTVSGTVTMVNNGCGSNLNSNIAVRFTLYDNTGCAGSQMAQWTETFAGVNIPALGGTQVFTITPHNFTADMVVNSTSCQVSIRMEADYNDTICESDGTDNTSCSDKLISIPDLTVNSVIPAASCLADGNIQGTVTVNVSNTGCGDANNVVVRLTSDCGLMFADQTVNLTAGSTTNLTFNFTPTAANCTCVFTATIDPTDAICESSGTNNTAASVPNTLNIPDIEVQADSLAVNCSADGQVTVSGTVTLINNGCGANLTNDIPVRFTLFDNTGCGGNQVNQWTETFTGVNIPSGGGTQAFTITPQTVTADMVTNSTGCRVSIFVEADYPGAICEFDGTDNTYCADNKAVDIPDIGVSGDTLGVTCFDDGQVTVSGTVTMVNNGCGSNLTTDIPVRFTLYDNTGCSGNVVDQWTETLAGVNIAAGGGTQVFTITSYNITTNLVNNSTGCQVSIRLEADYTDTICESDGTDNTYCADNKPVDIPDIQVQNEVLDIDCTDDGQYSITGTVTLVNNGCGSNLNTNIPMRFTLYDNTGCGGSQVAQWTETFAGVNIPAGGGTQTFTITAYNAVGNLVTNSTACQVSLLIEADYPDSICESDGTDNTLCRDKTLDIPNLVVNNVNTVVTCISDGNLTGTTVSVSNNGCADANNVVVRLVSDCGLTFTDQTINLTAGETRDVVFNFTAGITSCNCNFTATIDPGNIICESDGTDNTVSSPSAMSISDIEVDSDSLAVSCADDGQVTVSGTVTLINNGCGSALTDDIPIRFTLYDNTGCGGNQVTQWTQTFTGVNMNSEGGTQTFAINPYTFNSNLVSNSTNCLVSIFIEADYNLSVCEWDGTDNTYCADNKDVDIPDLRTTDDTLAVSCFDDGQITVSGTVTMTNDGCGSNLTDNIPVRFTLYDNTGCGGNVVAQWTDTLTGVNIPANGGSQALTINPYNITTNLVTNSTNCRVSIFVEADYNDAICESDGTNNTYCADNKPVDIPDIEVQSDALDFTCTDDGQFRVSGTVTLVNNGCGSNLTNNIPMRFTLFDNTGCGGNQVSQWTETFSSVSIPAGGGTQTFTINPHDVTANICANSTNCQVSLLIEADYTNTCCESDGTDNTLCSDKAIDIPELTINSVASTVVCLGDGNLAGTTVNVSNTGCGPASGVVVRLISDCGLTFADQTVDLAAGETRDVFFPFTAGITTCTCNFTATIDPGSTICECDGTNNIMTSPQDMIIPDLEIQSEALVVTCLDDGVIRASGTVTLVNNGCGPDFVDNIPMRFTLFNRPGCSGTRVNQWTQTFTGVSIASAGGTQTFTLQLHDITTNFCTNSLNCQVSILIEADYNNSICEWDGTDNTYCTNKTSDCLDLEAAAVTANTNCAEDAALNGTIAVTVRNSGGNPITSDFYVRVDDGQGWSSELRYNADLGGTLPLAAGATSIVTFAWNRTFENDTCDYTNITPQVDSQNEICQCTTENDTIATSYQMPLPNLTPTAITPGCSTDGNYRVQVTVENNGCSDAGSFTVHLEDNLGNSMDITVDSLAKGASTTVDFNQWPATCDPASVTFTAFVDSNNDVCEITGSDNTMEQVYINTSPDLVITEVKPSATCRAPGDINGMFEITLQNSGNGAAGQDFKVIIDDGQGWSTEQFYQADLQGTLPVAAGETVTLRINWNRDFTKEPFKCNFNNIVVSLDTQTSVCECGAGNNEMMVTYRLPYPDLVIQSLLPICSEDGLRQIQLTIGNNGCEDQKEDFNITFSDNRGGTRTASFTAMGGTLPLKKGSPQTVTLTQWEFDCTADIIDYTAAISHEAGGCDLLDTNNTLTLTHTMEEPDLLFGDIQWTCNVDGSITFTVTVSNNGFGAAAAVPVHIYDSNGSLVYNQTIDLPKGTQKQFTFTTGSFPQDQNLTFRFLVDETDNYCECDGSNNEKSISFVCPSTGEEAPLKISKSCPPGQQPGGLFRFEIQVENTGESDLTNARIEDFLPEGFQYVSGSSALNGQSLSDPQISDRLTWTIGTLKAGETMTLVFSAVADADIDPGRYCNETQAVATLYGDVLTVTSEKVQCCTVVVRQAGAGCCLKVEEWALEPGQIPDGPLSFIEPYFQTESAMFTIYSIFNLWKDMELEKGTMPLFMKERLHNYARSTIEEFYLDSRLGLTLPDGTLWLSYAGAYPEREHSWVRKQVDETMTASQIGFELLALDKALKIEERREVQQKLKEIIDRKLTFLAIFIDILPHAWEIKKDKAKGKDEDDDKVVEAIEKYVNRKDDKTTLYDVVSLYLAMVELKNSGYINANIENFAGKLREMLKNIDNQEFDDNNLREEFLFTLALLESGENEQAKAKIHEFEKILATEDTENTEGVAPPTDYYSRNTQMTEEKPENESKVLQHSNTGGAEERLATKIHKDTQRRVLDNLHDYALAAAVDYKANGTAYEKIMQQMKEKYYLKDTGVFAEKQPDFTFKLSLSSLAPMILAFDTKELEKLENYATVLYRTFDEVGLFLKKRNLSVGKPLYSLLKNYPFTEPLLPVLNFTKANQDIAPVFSKDAVIHSTQIKPIGEILIPQTFSKILSPSYETSASRIAAVSFGLQYFGRKLMEKAPWVIKEEGRSFDETGKTYVDSLLKSGAGIQYKGKTLLPFDDVAIKGPKQGEHNLEPLNAGTGAQISTETLANYLLAEKLYVQGKGKYADTVGQIMAYQDQVVKQFKDTGSVPETFTIFIENDTEKITVIPSKTKALKLTAAKLFHVLPKDDNHQFLETALKKTRGKLIPEDLIFLAAVPEMVSYFEKEIQTLVDYKDSRVSYNAADIIGRRLLGDKPDKIRESLENLKKHWDKEAALPKSDLIENIERGLIYHHEPQQLLLYLLATHEVMDFRFERTLNFFTYLLENEWGVAWNSFITLPSARFQVFREEAKEHVEPGDLLSFRVRVDNTCPEGFGSAHDLPSLYLKAAFTPSLIYAGTQRVDGLDVLGDFQWRYSGLVEGSVLEYIYQALVPKDFSTNFINGWIYAGGRQGFEEFGPESAVGDECEDIDQVRRLNIIPFQEIQGLVYEDTNVNSIKDVGERGIPNILIKDTRGRLFRSDGEGRFTVLAGDQHEGIQVELKSIPANYLLISNPTQLVNRNYTSEIYFGLIPCKTVTGFVYLDENQDGAYDEGEPRPEGVLLKAKDKEVITGKDGEFIFRNLPELWQQWIEVKQEQLYYKGSIDDLRFNIDSKE